MSEGSNNYENSGSSMIQSPSVARLPIVCIIVVMLDSAQVNGSLQSRKFLGATQLYIVIDNYVHLW